MKLPVRLQLAFALLVSLQSSGASAQSPQSTCDQKGKIASSFCGILQKEFKDQRFAKGGAEPTLLDPLNQPIPTVSVLFDAAFGATVLQAAANQVAQVISTKAAVPQAGANTSASGSTSLGAKPTTTDLISLAAESGAFTQTVNGTTLTARANMNGLRRYLSGDNFAATAQGPKTADKILQPFTLAATFNVAQSGSAAASTTGQATSTTPTDILSVLIPSNNVSFSSLSVSRTINRRYNPTSTKFVSAWNKAIGDKDTQTAITNASNQLYTDYQKAFPNSDKVNGDSKVVAARADWQHAAEQDEAENNFDKFVDDFIAYMTVYVAALKSNAGPNYEQNIVAVGADLAKLKTLRDNILQQARGTFATLSYTYSTPTGKPATHDATAVFAYVWQKSGDQLTFNVAGSWFATIPPGAKYGKVKDYQFTGEYDHPFGKDKSAPRAIFSLAGYGQYQYTANVLNITVANVVPGTNISVPSNSQVFTSTPGWLSIAQTKLVFNIGKGASIPVAVKWSNKTDLLSDSDWKGQFGFSYDLSALNSILAPK
ncbi:hypothetical protein EDE15_3564 [Edaphobacter aggregans]|uniref:Uncharacterized protein n=1 Tax=Edaphobacter aggregans TaxID=570835 RepID=A0A428MM63_9BACT|nr:hypothetical protein [Edaphobacter aggregans]RSL18008.1 hypothetical protein EDE15_3564 [Edaphobacter aggregans]